MRELMLWAQRGSDSNSSMILALNISGRMETKTFSIFAAARTSTRPSPAGKMLPHCRLAGLLIHRS